MTGKPDLQASAWALDREDGAPLARHLVFLPEGRIGGSMHRSMTRWFLHDDRLRIFDSCGNPSASFSICEPQDTIPGVSVIHGPINMRRLPVVPHYAPPPRSTARRRRNLVVLRAGPTSLHPFWTSDIADEDRNWDLCLSWYGDPAARPAFSDHFYPASGTKFEGLADIFTNETLPWDYDYVWLPDDDLMTSWSDINLMFALCAEYDLMLAQPSLDKDCFINHMITRQDSKTAMRFCSFVEIMAPVFSHAALALCAPTFGASKSGYGLDHVWPRLIGSPPNKIAIIDAMRVIHTRPIGATYDLAAAIAEGNALQDEYGAIRRYQVFGYVLAEPIGFVQLRDPATGRSLALTGEAARQACA